MKKRFFEEDLDFNFSNPVAGIISALVMILLSPYIFVTSLATKMVYLGPESIKRLFNVAIGIGAGFTGVYAAIAFVTNPRLFLYGKTPVALFAIAVGVLAVVKVVVQVKVFPQLEEVLDVISHHVEDEEYKTDKSVHKGNTTDAVGSGREVFFGDDSDEFDSSSAEIVPSAVQQPSNEVYFEDDYVAEYELKDTSCKTDTLTKVEEKQERSIPAGDSTIENSIITSEEVNTFQNKVRECINNLTDISSSVSDVFTDNEIKSIEAQFDRNKGITLSKLGVNVKELLKTSDLVENDAKFDFSAVTVNKAVFPMT